MRGPPWQWRWRCKRGRPPKERLIWSRIGRTVFIPLDARGLPMTGDPIYVMPDEYEALRLVYLEKLTQEEAADKMGISRGTLWRILDNARRKVIQALVEKRPIIINV